MAEEEVHLNSMAMMMSNFSLVIYYSFLKKKKNRREKTIQMEKFSIREDWLEGGFPPSPYS